MLKKLDSDFSDMLQDSAKVEQRLAELASQRFMFGISAVASAVVVFSILFMMLSAHMRLSGQPNQPLVVTPVSGCLTMVFVSAIALARAIGAHGEIRTLLTFKKLRDLRSID
ncbi:MAG: hypothetical protein H8M99_04160 [Gloeobacteraceae cyanobacterium ES-bin-144]|nr:hypothetical protein [Verrucomicrobiales bacterium]